MQPVKTTGEHLNDASEAGKKLRGLSNDKAPPPAQIFYHTDGSGTSRRAKNEAKALAYGYQGKDDYPSGKMADTVGGVINLAHLALKPGFRDDTKPLIVVIPPEATKIFGVEELEAGQVGFIDIHASHSILDDAHSTSPLTCTSATAHNFRTLEDELARREGREEGSRE